jgi:hypothetical protein
MAANFDRRSLLRASVVTAAAVGVGVGVGVVAPGASASGAPVATAGATIPIVPGMTGDPRANEFWYQYDEVFLLNRPQEIADALVAVRDAMGGSIFNIRLLWSSHRAAGTYPDGFIEAVAPAREPLAFLSQRELEVFDAYYRCDPRGMATGFVEFGEGVLYDPRRADGLKVHMMNTSPGVPPQAYHLWHAILRARMLLGVDTARWAEIDPFIGLAWAAQSVAKPVTDAHNPWLQPRVVADLKRSWLRKDPRQLDTEFDSSPYPLGIS